MENLINPSSQSQLPPGRAADLAEVTFFSQPSPPDPQLAALKTYASWFAAMMFAVIASFAVYSWLEASNVIGRLIGENAAKTQVQTLEPLRAVNSQRKASVPSFTKVDAGEGDVENAAISGAGSTTAAMSDETLGTKSTEADKDLPDNKAKKKPKAQAKTITSSSSVSDVNQDAPASNVLPPLPTEKSEAETVQQLPIDNPEQAFAPEAVPVQSQAESPAAGPSAPQAKSRKHVIVTQIEPNKNKNSGAKVASPVEDFFRRWKKSIKQGVSDRPCTQQEKALNQCYN